MLLCCSLISSKYGADFGDKVLMGSLGIDRSHLLLPPERCGYMCTAMSGLQAVLVKVLPLNLYFVGA